MKHTVETFDKSYDIYAAVGGFHLFRKIRYLTLSGTPSTTNNEVEHSTNYAMELSTIDEKIS